MIGPSTKVGFSNGSRVERFELEGPKNPKRERRSGSQTKPLVIELDNGSIAGNSLQPGPTGPVAEEQQSERVQNRGLRDSEEIGREH